MWDNITHGKKLVLAMENMKKMWSTRFLVKILVTDHYQLRRGDRQCVKSNKTGQRRKGLRVRAGEDGDVGRPRAGQELNNMRQKGAQVTILIYSQTTILVQGKGTLRAMMIKSKNVAKVRQLMMMIREVYWLMG